MSIYDIISKKVYEALLENRNKTGLNFSVRQKASKGSETNYFIGTQKSRYFAFTLWNIPVSYPGSSVDLINVVVFFDKSWNYNYKIQFYQTRDPKDLQNKCALQLIKDIRQEITQVFNGFKTGKSVTMEYYAVHGPKDKYNSVDEMMKDVFNDLNTILSIVEKAILKIKEVTPEFRADKITDKEFQSMMERMNSRLIKFGKKQEESNEEIMQNETPKSKNLILYGPPGTGKTYSVVEEALKLIEPDFNINQNRDSFLKEFDQYVNNGQIIFTTFHQSMSYEDFIEGIKPLEPIDDNGQVIYKVEDGIFKRLCIDAAFSIAKESGLISKEEFIDFSDAYDSLVDDIENQVVTTLPTRNGSNVEVVEVSVQGNIIVNHGKEKTYTVSKNRLMKLNASIPDFDEIANINEEFRAIIGGSNSTAYWAVLNKLRNDYMGKVDDSYEASKVFDYELKMEVVNKMTKEDFKNSGEEYVIIIDEINRGNVSSIFGELITLIEDNKRLGREEALKSILPYSKQSFGVPHNVHIIGTMNTADRSVEALDAALRRRFEFKEVSANHELLNPYYRLGNLCADDKYWEETNYYNNKADYKLKESELFGLAGIKVDDKKMDTLFKNQNNDKLKWLENTPDEFEKIFKEAVIESEGIRLDKLLEKINKRLAILLDRDHQIGHAFFMNVVSLEDLKLVFEQKVLPLLQEYFYGDISKIALVLGDGFLNEVMSKNELLRSKYYSDKSLINDFEQKANYSFTSKESWNIPLFRAIYNQQN